MNYKIFPEKLYHYCSMAAFKSIIENKCFWLSFTENTNDATELKICRDIVYACLVDLIKEEKISQDRADAIWRTYNGNSTHGYIACFSEDGDLLNQWRSYADDGNGVAICVDFNRLNVKDSLPSYTYNEDHKYVGKKVEYADDYFCDNFRTLVKENYDINADGGFYNFLALTKLSYSVKHYAFKDEREWRIIHLPMLLFNENSYNVIDTPDTSSAKFRVIRNQLLSYFEFTIVEDSVVEVVLGPKNKSNVLDLKLFLSLNGYKKAIVKKSGIPYQ